MSKHIRVTQTYVSGELLLEGLKSNEPDVLLLDIHMPGKTGDKLISVITKKYPAVKILMLTHFDSSFYVKNTLQHGALGYLLKSVDPVMLVEAIETVYNGKEFIDPSVHQQVGEPNLRSNRIKVETPVLNTREKEIIQLTADGKTSQEIADTLFLSVTTVDNYRYNLLAKFGVRNTAMLIKKAVQLGLVD